MSPYLLMNSARWSNLQTKMSCRGTSQLDSSGNGKGEKLESNLKSSLQEKDRLVEPYFTINLEFMDSSLKEEQEETVHRSVFHCNYI